MTRTSKTYSPSLRGGRRPTKFSKGQGGIRPDESRQFCGGQSGFLSTEERIRQKSGGKPRLLRPFGARKDVLGECGTILFEAFVALTVLAVGISGILRVFSESLYAGKMNVEKAGVTREVEKNLFDWFVIPERLSVSEAGRVHLTTSEHGHAYHLLLESERLISMESSKEPVPTEAAAPPVALEPEKKKDYYKVDFQVMRDDGAPMYAIPVILTSAAEIEK